jgi:two-component system sensor histidine kinase KdpD
VDPGDIINAAIENKRRQLAGHQLHVAVEDDLPLVHADPMLIEKALGHLIENAAKYSPSASPISVSASLEDGMIRLSVKDKGDGLTREEQDLIWERFYRSPRHRDNTAGSGLGLWISRALVTACSGRVEALSAGAARGATLSIYLPLPQDAAPSRAERSG